MILKIGDGNFKISAKFGSVIDEVIPLIEEILNCSTGGEKEKLANRLLEILEVTQKHNWVDKRCEAKGSNLEGMGLFVREGEHVQRGELVAIFGGKPHTLEEGCSLEDDLVMGHIMIDSGFTIGASTRTEVDAGDFVNHSCNPSCEIRGQISLYAGEDIEGGREITFDYSTILRLLDIDELPRNFPEALVDRVNARIILFSDCQCGADNCRGKITSKDLL